MTHHVQSTSDEPLISERGAKSIPGWPAVWACALLIAAGIVLVAATGPAGKIAGVCLIVIGVIGLRGLVVVVPGEARVVLLFGRYSGTIRSSGMHWVNPLTQRPAISVRVRNHQTEVVKVNDADGNPIEIAAVLVWQVTDTAKAVFAVDDYPRFVAVQAETAVRHIAGSYPYDSREEDQLSLLQNAEEITAGLAAEVANRVLTAGATVVEARLIWLSYAPEIAAVMLRRQQASAVIAARRQILDGAVGMVRGALDRLSAEGGIELDEERRAAMVSNLLVVLCSEQQTQPVVNTGSLYQ